MKKIFAGHLNVVLQNSCRNREKTVQHYFIHIKLIYSLETLFCREPPVTKLANASLPSLALFFATTCFGTSAYSLSLSFQIISLPNKHCTVPQALTIKVSLVFFSLITMSYLALCTYLPAPALSHNSFVTRIQGQFYCNCTIFSLYIMLSA